MAKKKNQDTEPKVLTFTFSSIGKKSFMDIEKPPDAWITASIIEPGVLHFDGNSKGFIYLGKYLVAMGIRDVDNPAVPGYHVHFAKESGELDVKGEMNDVHEIYLTNADDPK